jgi:flavin-binding protein dodecin
MAQSSHKLIDPESTYDVVELIGTSTESWEDAAKNVIEQAGEHLRELRVAEVVAKDMVIHDGKVELPFCHQPLRCVVQQKGGIQPKPTAA